MRYEIDMGIYLGELGEFRKNRAEVAHSTFAPISEFYVRQAMELLVKWINCQLKKKTYDPVVLAAMAHVWFESIHPFTATAIETAIKEMVNKREIGFGKVMTPLRLIFVGSNLGPGLMDIMEVLGKEEVLGRIDTGLERIPAIQS